MNIIQELIPQVGSGGAPKIQADEFPNLEYVIGLAESPTESLPGSGALPFEDLLMTPDSPMLTNVQKSLHPDDAINIQFTSGTTGLAKGTTLTHMNILNNGLQVGHRMGLTQNDKVCVPVRVCTTVPCVVCVGSSSCG